MPGMFSTPASATRGIDENGKTESRVNFTSSEDEKEHGIPFLEIVYSLIAQRTTEFWGEANVIQFVACLDDQTEFYFLDENIFF